MRGLVRAIDYLIAGVAIIGLFLATIGLCSKYTSTWPQSYFFHDYSLVVALALATFIVGIIIMLNIAYYTNIAKSLFEDENKRISFHFFYRFYMYYTLSLLSMTVGLIWFILEDDSKGFFTFLGCKIFLYPMSLAFTTILAFATLVYFYLFTHNEYRKRVSKINIIGISIIFIVAAFISSLPDNYYGVVTPPNVFDFRPITNGILLILYLYVIVMAVIFIEKRIKLVEQKLIKNKLRLTELGYVVIIFFFVFYTLDALFGGGKPYTIFMIPAYISMFLGMILVYLGSLTPSWLEKRLG